MMTQSISREIWRDDLLLLMEEFRIVTYCPVCRQEFTAAMPVTKDALKEKAIPIHAGQKLLERFAHDYRMHLDKHGYEERHR